MARKKVEISEINQDAIENIEVTQTEEVGETKKESPMKNNSEKQNSEMDFLKAQNQDLQNKILEMQQMMLQMQMNNQMVMQQSTNANNKAITKVKSYSYDKICLCTKDGYNNLVSFSKYGEEKNIPTKQFTDAILDERNRRFFEQGILAFVDESDYEEHMFYNVQKPLSIEYLEELLQKDENTIFSTLDMLTSNKQNGIVSSVISGNIINSIDNISIKGNLVSKLNRYFGVDIYKMANNYFLYNYHKQGKVSRKEEK